MVRTSILALGDAVPCRSLRRAGTGLVAVVLAVALLIGTGAPARAQGLNIIRDTEIENLLQAYARPVFQAGGLEPNAITIRLIQDNSINAFVTQGNAMFIHTGLLLAAKNSNEVIGVMAHETGHMVGGHAVTFDDSIAKANTTALLTTLLGVAAGVLAKNPDVGMAVAMGGQGTALRQILAFSRDQESRADQFAITALNETKQSPKGLYDFFNRLSGQELLSVERQDPYMLTHPLTRTRMEAVAEAVRLSPYSDKPLDPAIEAQHRRMIAKLFAFLKPQITTLQRYPESDQSVEARYARSVAYFRRGQTDKALPLIDGLIAEFPKDPYFWELKGQMLFETGKLDESVAAYRTSTTLLPNAPLNQISMAHAMVETGNPAYGEDAQKALKAALAADPEDPWAWDLLAKSYLQSDKPGMSAYAASERALLLGQFQDVVRYSREAEKLLEKDTPTWYRLQDIRVTAQNQLQELVGRRRR
jgi:predicted Zn-dependent protease